MEAKIASLEGQLAQAMQSGDEATQALRKQLADVTSAFDDFKVTSKQEFESMQSDLNEKHRKEMEALKRKYEDMMNELK